MTLHFIPVHSIHVNHVKFIQRCNIYKLLVMKLFMLAKPTLE
jgi:hypothetical protein